MKQKYLNKKGIAILLVAVLIFTVVPVTLVMYNLTTSQKKQSKNFESILKLEQISLSGINKGYSQLKNNSFRPETLNEGTFLKQSLSSIEQTEDYYDLFFKHTGFGFFNQDIYLMVSKSEKTDSKGKIQSSIIVTDAEQFQQNESSDAPYVMAHDYWTTQNRHDVNEFADFSSLRNERGLDQMRWLEVKKQEMDSTVDEFAQSLNDYTDKLPLEIKTCWPEVIDNIKKEKINNTDYIPPASNDNDNQNQNNTNDSNN